MRREKNDKIRRRMVLDFVIYLVLVYLYWCQVAIFYLFFSFLPHLLRGFLCSAAAAAAAAGCRDWFLFPKEKLPDRHESYESRVPRS